MSFALLIIALVLFILAGLGVPSRLGLGWLGLASYVAAPMLGGESSGSGWHFHFGGHMNHGVLILLIVLIVLAVGGGWNNRYYPQHYGWGGGGLLLFLLILLLLGVI